MKVYINATKREKKVLSNRRPCVFHTMKDRIGCLLSVATDKHSLLYTIILCRIRAKLLTATIEQNEGEQEQVLLSSSILSITDLLKAYFGLSYPSCHREFFFFSLLVISLYSKDSKKRESSANGLEAKCTLQSLPWMMLYAS
jgi:hypothetical protein